MGKILDFNTAFNLALNVTLLVNKLPCHSESGPSKTEIIAG